MKSLGSFLFGAVVVLALHVGLIFLMLFDVEVSTNLDLIDSFTPEEMDFLIDKMEQRTLERLNEGDKAMLLGLYEN